MTLNDSGQCPACLIKPLVYKRDRKKFCHRCDRAFDIDTGEQIDNWAWQRIDGMFEQTTLGRDGKPER